MPRQEHKQQQSQQAKSKQRTQTTSQRLLREVHDLYTAGDVPLEAASRELGLNILPPRRKVTVLIMGNHSAGKSSFINWYLGEHVQQTGVGIETKGFTFVTHGTAAHPAPIKGEATLMMFPHIKGMKEEFGRSLVENLTSRVSTSTSKCFPMVDLIDTPGLVDGEVAYPFDVNNSIAYLADHADLILCMLDPIGQALCSRTMDVIQLLNEKHYALMKYYLTKADTITKAEDLMKVVVQISQSLHARVKDQNGFEIPAIFLPDHGADPDSINAEVNQIGKLCKDIETTIHQKVQDNLNQLEDDCGAISAEVDAQLALDAKNREARKARSQASLALGLLAWVIPVLAFLYSVVAFKHLVPAASLESAWVQAFFDNVEPLMAPVIAASPEGVSAKVNVVVGIIAAFVVLVAVSKFFASRAARYAVKTRAELERLATVREAVAAALAKREQLYVEYFNEFRASED